MRVVIVYTLLHVVAGPMLPDVEKISGEKEPFSTSLILSTCSYLLLFFHPLAFCYGVVMMARYEWVV